MKRTISLKLNLSQDHFKALLELQEAFAQCCNQIVPYSYDNHCSNQVALHHLCYRVVREQLPRLGSQMVCNAIKKVASAYKVLRKKKRPDCPLIHFGESASIHLDKRTYSLKGHTLSLYTLGKRIKVEFVPGAFQLGYLQQGVAKEAELVRKGKRWFFNLVLDLPESTPAGGDKMLGVDLGENNLAVTSNGVIYGGGELRHERDKFLALRGRLQSKGTQSAKQLLRKVSGREERHVRHTNHEISKSIITEAKKGDIGILVMEDLTNIRKRIKGNKRMRCRLHRWAFGQLQSFIEYKAQAAGIKVVYTCPAYSSLTCSVCHALGTREKHRFTCTKCGSQQHADRNACQNLCRFAASADAATCAVNRTHVAA